MSTISITAALEAALRLALPTDKIVYENEPLDQALERYLAVSTVFAKPSNREFGSNFQELGIFTVMIVGPIGEGWGSSRAKAETIRAAFKRATSLVGSGGAVVIIDRTPEVVPAYRAADHWIQPVRVSFYVNTKA